MAIPRNEMDILNPAATLREIVPNAEKDAQIASVAYSLNNAANTGQYTTVWLGRMLPEVKTELEANGYVVEPTKLHTGEAVQDSWTISFKDEVDSEGE